MRRCLIICAALTAGCGKPDVQLAAPFVPADLLQPCLTPPMRADTEGRFAAKVLRIAADRDCANARIVTIGEILGKLSD